MVRNSVVEVGVGPLVMMVRVEVCEEESGDTETETGLKVQIGAGVTAGEMERQDRVTVPV
jgi:hypothetical protein